MWLAGLSRCRRKLTCECPRLLLSGGGTSVYGLRPSLLGDAVSGVADPLYVHGCRGRGEVGVLLVGELTQGCCDLPLQFGDESIGFGESDLVLQVVDDLVFGTDGHGRCPHFSLVAVRSAS